jgi:uncharacterized RDD family membrane protein YckC
MSEPIGMQYGGFWVRLVALLVDSAIVFLVASFLLAGSAMALAPESIAPLVLAMSVLGLLYWPLMHASALQATFGKLIMGLKVARLDGRRISIVRSLGRELAKILSGAVLMVGYLMAAITPRKRALHDLMASTYVVRQGPSRRIFGAVVVVAGFALPVVLIPTLRGAVMPMMTNLTESFISPLEGEPPASAQTAEVPAPEQNAATSAVARITQAITTVLASISKLDLAKPAPGVAPGSPESKGRAARAPKPAPVAAYVPRPGGPKYNDLMTAVIYRDAESVTELLRLGKWPDKPDSRGATPLMAAVELGDLRTAEALLRGGANPSRAIRLAQERRNREMILLLNRYSRR